LSDYVGDAGEGRFEERLVLGVTEAVEDVAPVLLDPSFELALEAG
jgi:hypothetical protein